jgi:hypothetical protein
MGCGGDSEEGTFPKPDAGVDGAADADADVDADKPDTGGDADADADGPECPYSLTFAAPADGAQLTGKDDADGDFCANGFQYHVTLATNAPDGTTVTLSGNAGKIADATVAAGLVRFSSVQLPSMGSEVLRADIAQTTCTSSANLSVACEGAPECAITAPVITQTHPKLNGVPVGEGGDRVSAAGSPYQVAFEVKTTVEDGQPVILNVDGNALAVSTNAVGGVASFAGVTLVPDGDHTVSARCVPKLGIEGQSTSVTYLVDTEAPPLVAKKVRGTEQSDLQDGDHWNPEHDADPNKDGLQLRICGATDASDALNLPSTLGAGQQNFCVAVGSSSPSCVPATTDGAGDAGDGGCVDIDCPGGGPFDLTLTMRDDAGNPTGKTTQAVTCASTLPQVQFLDPVSDGPPWNDIDKRILAASMAGQVARVDKDATKSGAQYDVVVCTNASGGTARLMSGVQGGTMTEIGQGTVTADAANLCTGFTHIVTFADVTLTASQQATDGTLTNPTVLTAEITDESNGTGTSSIQIWVDSRVPTLEPASPNPLCGTVVNSAVPVAQTLRFISSVVPVRLTVTPQSGSPTQYTETTFSEPERVTFASVGFELGESSLYVESTEPSGNVATIPVSGQTCIRTVGKPPVVTWTTPVAGLKLAASGTSGAGILPDADPATPGWQGALAVCTDINVSIYPTATVQFTQNATDIGTPVVLDAVGCAQIANATLPEGQTVVLAARTSEIDGLTGTATLLLPVDVQAPNPVEGLTATVLDRRQTSFRMAWTAPADNISVSAYHVRVSESPISNQAEFDAATPVTYLGVPAASGSPDGINVVGKLIERDYYFAVESVDFAGNRGEFRATSTPTRAEFNETILVGSAGEVLGRSLDATTDLNKDSLSDLIVGADNGRYVYVHFGTPTGFLTTPDVVIDTGAAGCGRASYVLGDIDSDGEPDIGISCPNQVVYVVRGRALWPSTLTLPDDAAMIVSVDGVADPGFTNSAFGSMITRIGDFNGDGVHDFAISAPFYNQFRGLVAIVYGATGNALPATIALPQDIGPRVNTIQGETTNGRFGFRALGLGNFYSSTTSTLLVSAPFLTSGTGTVYSFAGALPSPQATVTLAAHTYSGPAQSSLFGIPLTPLGNIGGSSHLDFAIGAPRMSDGGIASVLIGSQTEGPFGGATWVLTNPGGTAGSFPLVLAGGGISGTSLSTSLLGDNTPDLVAMAKAASTEKPTLYVIAGEDLNMSANISDAASVTYDRFPADWAGTSSETIHVGRDTNGDGYGDVLIGELSTTPIPGRVVVLW